MESQNTPKISPEEQKLLDEYKAAAAHRYSVVTTPRNAVTLAQARASSIIPNPVSMMDVQLKATAFQYKMQQLSQVLTGFKDTSHLQITDTKQFYSQLYIDKASIGRLNTIAMNSDFECFGIFFGLEDAQTKEPLKDLKGDHFGRLTCCFVGLDKNMEVMEDHFPPTNERPYSVLAEDTWPPPPPPNNPVNTFKLSDDTNKLFEFFNARQPQNPPAAIPASQTPGSAQAPAA